MTTKLNRYLLSAIAAATLVGCGGDTQDVGDATKTYVSGRAVDGPIAQGYVYLDTNGNNMLDGWEPYALTDEDGYFSYNPNKHDNNGTPSDDTDDTYAAYNYCAKGGNPVKPSGEPEDQASQAYADYIASSAYQAYLEAKDDEQFCLKVPTGISKAPLRIANGLDLTTSQTLSGSMTLYVNVGKGSYTTPQVLSPISAMLYAANESETSVYPANELVTDTTLLASDYMDSSNSLTDADRISLAHMAMMAQKPASVISRLIDLKTTKGDFEGSSTDYPYDMMPHVQAQIADRVTGTETLRSVLDANGSSITTDAWQAVSDELAEKEIVFSAPSTAIVNDIVTRLDGLPAFIDDLFDDAQGALDVETYIVQRFRAIEVVASLMRGRKTLLLGIEGEPTFADTTAINQAMTAALTDPLYLTYIGDANADVPAIVAIFEAGSYVDAESINFAGRVSFDEQFRAVDGGRALDLISDGGDTTFGFVFNDDGTATVDFQIGGETALSTGSQQTVNTTYEQVDENTIVMNMELVPGTGIYQPVTMKTNKDGTGYTVDYGSGPEEFVTTI